MRILLPIIAILATPIQADVVVHIGTSLSIPPYVITHNDSGIALDLTREALAASGLDSDVHYGNNAKNIDDFNQGNVNALLVAQPQLTPSAFFSSKPVMIFHNVIITLKRANYHIEKVSDLDGLRIGAFSLAKHLLPKPFTITADLAPSYTEYTQQIEQVEALYNGDCDAIIMDRLIFLYYLSKLRHKNPPDIRYQESYVAKELFEPSEYFMAFSNEAHRDAFDKGIAMLRSNGRYENIINSYQQTLSHYLIQ
jgi:polar amino acid transport system substrate-binding protein